MNHNEFAKKLTSYQRVTGKMAQAGCPAELSETEQLTPEQVQAMLDACNHSKSSYAEEALAQDLRKLREQFEQSQKGNDENLRKQKEQHDAEWNEQARENRFNRVCNVIAVLIAFASMVISLVK